MFLLENNITIFDKEERLKSVLVEVEKKLKTSLNKVRVGHTSYSVHDGLGYVLIETDCKEYIGDQIFEILSKSKYGIHKETLFSEGFLIGVLIHLSNLRLKYSSQFSNSGLV